MAEMTEVEATAKVGEIVAEAREKISALLLELKPEGSNQPAPVIFGGRRLRDCGGLKRRINELLQLGAWLEDELEGRDGNSQRSLSRKLLSILTW